MSLINKVVVGKAIIADFVTRVFAHQVCIWAACLHQVVCRSFLIKVVVGKAAIADFLIRVFTHQLYTWGNNIAQSCVDVFS